MPELAAGVCGGEQPMDLDNVCVALSLPRGDLLADNDQGRPRRLGHWLDKTANSDSATFSRLPCLGVR